MNMYENYFMFLYCRRSTWYYNKKQYENNRKIFPLQLLVHCSTLYFMCYV